MEEKKKRVRPTWAMVRDLQTELANAENMLQECYSILNNFSDFESIIRDNVVYKQALINFSAMIRAKKDPAILIQSSQESEGLINIVYNDIKKRWDEDANKLHNENETLKKSNKLLEEERIRLGSRNETLQAEYEMLSRKYNQLKERGLLDRIINKV